MDKTANEHISNIENQLVYLSVGLAILEAAYENVDVKYRPETWEGEAFLMGQRQTHLLLYGSLDYLRKVETELEEIYKGLHSSAKKENKNV